MAKQLNVDMRFNADTSQAKRAIQDLQNSLSTIAKMPGNASNLFDDTEIKKASKAALELQGHLQKAVNVNTGKLDLSRFASSLKTSNKDLSIYANTLLNTGKQGQQAFLQLAQAIATADTPVTRINAKLTDLGVTLKNTAKWQISSSVLHGFMGAVQSAYGYAQDLNESLNNIRIVTGQNIDQMARFAETANRAAKALSTTTTDYTNASLIYYQQGLNDQQVQERTDITIKMANVARQSAEVVSDQMTAVWNNFDNGSKSLEYYADVMTALGAATASSTDEIAAGLEKFAAVSETVGLSYEYATAALATVTDKTRQSADVVGTAFKTMFARIQGLKLGETLEDGTDFNQYSEALMAVGVNIKTANGELKNMDTILNEMAAVWETLNRDEQVALAQKVAGVRQYNQLVSLMENWDAMEMNLGVVETSEGALQEQADIYAESWEAAQDRVRAAAEGVYQDLIDDEFFITLLNGFEKVIETIDGVVQGLGGMQGVITLVGSLFLTQFAQKMPEALNNLRQNFMVFTGQSKKVMSEMQNELNLTLTAQKADPGLSESYKIQLEGIQKINTMKQKLVAVSKSLTSQEQEEYKIKIQNVEAMYKEAAALAEKKKAAEQLEAKTQKTAENTAIQKSSDIFKQYNDSEAEVSNLMDKATTPSKSAEDTAAYTAKIEETRKKAVALEMSIEKIKTAIKDLDEVEDLDDVDIGALMGVGTADQQAAAQGKVTKAIKETSEAFKSQIKQRSNLEEMSSSIVSQGEAWKKVAQEVKKVESDKVKNLSNVIDTTKQKMAAYLQIIQKIAKDNGLELNAEDVSNLANKINSLDSNNIEEITNDFSTFANEVSGKAQNAIGGLDTSIGNLRRTMSNLQFDPTEVKEMEQAADGAATATQELKNSMDNIGGVVDENVEGTFKMSVALTEFASVAMSVSSLISSLKGVINTFTDEGASGFEKFGALLSIIMPAMSTFNAIQSLATTLSKNATIAKWAETKATAAATTAKWAENAAWLASPITWIVGAILGVVAALGLLAAGISAVTKALNDSYNAEAIAAEKANKELEEQQENLEATKQKYQELTDAINDYKESENALSKLTRGTEEWKQKVEELNQQVTDLIVKYPELAKYLTKNSDGVLGFSENGLEELQEFQDQAVKNEQYKTYSRQIESNTANKYADIAEVGKEAGYGWNQEFFANLMDKYVNIYREQGEAGLLASEHLKNAAAIADMSMEEFLGSIREWASTDDVNQVLLEQQAATIASSNQNYQTSKYKDVIDQQIANQIQSEKTEADFKEEKRFSQNVKDNYLKLKYGDQAENYRFADTKGGDVTIEKKNEDGGWDSVEDKRNEIDKSDIVNEYNKLAKEESVKKEAENYDIDGVIAGLDKFEATMEKAGFSSEGAETFTRAKGMGETVNLGELSDADISLLRDKVANSRSGSYQGLTSEDLQSYDAKGGSLGARNASFSELYQAVENPAEGSSEEALAQLKTFRDEALSVYNELNEEDKRLFAETMDFKTVTNAETMKQILAQEKEARADAKIESDAEKYGLDANVVKAQAAQIQKSLESVAKSQDKTNKSGKSLGKGLKQTNLEMEDAAEIAAEMAVANQRMNKGVDSLTDNWKDWKKALKGTDKTTQDYAEAVVGVSDSLRDILRLTDDELIPEDFVTSDETIKLLDQVANGSEEAVAKLGYNLAEAQIKAQEITSDIATNLADMVVKGSEGIEVTDISEKFDTIKNNAITAIGEMQSAFAGLDPGQGLSGEKAENWANALNQYAEATGMSVEAMQSMLSKLQVKADVKVEEKTIKSKVPEIKKTRRIENPVMIDDGQGGKILGSYDIYETASTVGYKDADEVIQVAQINTDQPVNFTKVNSGTIAPSVTNGGKNKGGGGGGGSKPKPAQPTKKSDIVQRYKEQDDQLDDLKRTMDNAEKSLDRLYGEDKTKAIEKLIAAEKEYKKVLKEKRDDARDHLEEDRKALDAAASKVSVKFEYDAEGNLTNYTEQMEALYNRLRATEKAAGSEWTESEQKQIDALKDKIKELEEAKQAYEETRELIEDLSDELKDLAGKPAMPLIKSDYIDIYREITDALDDIDERLERIQKRADDLMGANRLSWLKKFEGASEDKLALINDEISKSTTDIKQNKTYLKRVSKLLDVDAPTYDDKGNVINYDEVTDILWQRVLDEQKKAKKNDGKISEAEQKAIDARIADVEMYTSASDKYRDSVEYREDLRVEKKEITDPVTVLPVVTNDFLDIYKEADDILDDIEHTASKIADEAERATGKDKVAKLKEMAKVEKERYQYLKKAQEINTSDKAEKKTAMENAATALKIPIQFAYDDNGNITNYNEIKQYYEQQYAAAYAEVMADGYINAEESDWLENFKSDGEAIEEYIQQYMDAVEQGENLEEQAREAEQAVEDYILEALSYTVELNIEADERDLRLIEYQLSQLEDQGYATAEVMGLIDKKYASLMAQGTSYTKGIDAIFKKYIDAGKLTQDAVNAFWEGDASGIDWSIFSQAEIDKINEYSDGIMSMTESLIELRNTMDEAVISVFEEWTAEMQEQLSLFDHYDSIINSYNNITDLVGQERLGISNEDRKKYNDLRVDNATNRLTSSKTYFDETKEKIASAENEKAAAEARLAAAQSSGDESLIKAAEQDVKMWEDTLKVMYQENRNAEQQYLADWEAALQASRDAFLAETEMELETFEKKMAGVYGSFDNMQKEFNRQSEKNDRYLQDYEKLYELSKLNRDLSNKIDDTTNLKAKKELAKLQEEILEYQEDGVKMSDYDLKFLQKKYDLKLAEIALEEAQNAKTQVRLTRDSEGNYSYTYTADEDSIAKAQQNYEDKLYEISNLSNDYIEQQTSKLLSTQQAFANELAEIYKKAAEGQYATTEEYNKALDDCTAYYTEQLAYYGDEIDKAAGNNSTIYENDYSTYEGWTVEKIKKTKEDADAYITGATDKSAAEAGFITSIRDLLPDLEEAHEDATGYVSAMTTEIGSAKEGTGLLGTSRKSYEDYGVKIDGVMLAAGTSTETFKDKVSEYLLTGDDSVAKRSDEAKQKIEAMASAVTNLDKTIANVSAWQTSYSGEIQKAIDKTVEFMTTVNAMNQSLAGGAEEEAGDLTPEEPKPVTETLENPITEVGQEDKCPICKKPMSQCKGHKPKEEKCPKCGKKPCKCKEIEAKKKAEEEAKRKAEEEAKKKKKLKADAAAIVTGVHTGTIKQTAAGWKPSAEKAGYSKEAIKLAQTAINESDSSKGWSYQYKKALAYISAYNTGGYTGAWGPSGKLALLHEKELVLNKEDTENMLKMISMVRDLVSILDIQAYQASLAQLAANQLGPVTNSQNAFEQTVTIHAEFPDAIYANEIETALNNLVNSASQFANRKY